MKVGDLVKDAYSEVVGLIIETTADARLNLKGGKEYHVLWFDPPGSRNLLTVKSWRRKDQLELVSGT